MLVEDMNYIGLEKDLYTVGERSESGRYCSHLWCTLVKD